MGSPALGNPPLRVGLRKGWAYKAGKRPGMLRPPPPSLAPAPLAQAPSPPAYWLRVHVSEAFPWGRQANCSPWMVLIISHTLLGTYYMPGTVTYLLHVHRLISPYNKPSMRYLAPQPIPQVGRLRQRDWVACPRSGHKQAAEAEPPGP